MTTDLIEVPIAPGELVDKISILEIKSERLTDAAKLDNIRRELALLREKEKLHIQASSQMIEFYSSLKEVNGRIWDLEDVIRDCERKSDFGDTFIKTARLIYRTNDERAAVKREINMHLGSKIVEEKSYAKY
ncbi:MAG: DUF6165 family protein [Hyphomicrobium sp.]